MRTMPGSRGTRRPELDLVRTVVVLGLIFFHTSLIFDERDDYYVKNEATSVLPTITAGLAVVWAMPALFMISGIGSWSSLRKRGERRFAGERLLRLGVPLVVATATIVPIPVWLRERSERGTDITYWEFLPQFFSVHIDLGDFPFVLNGAYFETGHLWFVVLLITFSLALSALWVLAPALPVRRITDRLAGAAEGRGPVLLAAIPLALVTAAIGMEESFAGWSRWAYLIFFLYGVVIASDDRLRAAMRRDAPLAAALGLALFAAGAPAFIGSDGDPFTDTDALTIAARAAFGGAGWFWVVAILGFLDRWYSRDETPLPGSGASWHQRAFRHLTIAALPIYVLHQPILVAVAYVVVDWDVASIWKYAVITTTTFALTLSAYELVIRRTRWTRLLLGLRSS